MRVSLVLALAVAASAAPVDYEREVRPLLAKRCLGCHGAALQMSHLRLDQRASVLKGGESGIPAIEPGHSGRSLLIRYVSGTDAKLVMPPKGPRLTGEEVGLLAKWIDEGAHWPGAEATPEPVADKRASHWAFQKLVKPEPPVVKDRSWVRNPIDAFVLSSWSNAAGVRILRRREAICCGACT